MGRKVISADLTPLGICVCNQILKSCFFVFELHIQWKQPEFMRFGTQQHSHEPLFLIVNNVAEPSHEGHIVRG